MRGTCQVVWPGLALALLLGGCGSSECPEKARSPVGPCALTDGGAPADVGGRDGGGSSDADAAGDAAEDGSTADSAPPDPCREVSCDDAPLPRCLDAALLRSFGARGTCVEGECRYTPLDTPCPHGCGEQEQVGAGCIGCAEECPAPGATECAAGKIRSCGVGDDGCRVWGPWTGCASGYCDGGASCGVCRDECPLAGAGECREDGQQRTCAADDHGCLRWSEYSPCPDGFCLNATTCGQCAHQCAAAGEVQCDVAQGRQRFCQADEHGCRAWGAFSFCPEGFCADAQRCGSCDHACPSAGQSECLDGRTRSCVADQHGCRAWSPFTPCPPPGFCADAGSCGECVHSCPAGGRSECAGGRLRTCQVDLHGCRAWSMWSPCPDGFCADGSRCGSCQHGCPLLGASEC
ncbi:MAG: hypothetical protein FJ125_16140, partial [Deltaproteobacteria bacterium]|nr:hypothetical protein [Deltaproteobacteria bacterium]